jgi:hypothetical protein
MDANMTGSKKEKKMPDYRITLVQNMRADEAPSALQVRYRYSNGQEDTWPVELLVPSETAVVFVSSPVNLLNRPNVVSKTLIGHYPTPPHTINYGISSIQPLLEANLRTELAATTGALASAAGSNYSITFAMPQATVDTLSANNFSLFGFKAVKSTSKGSPVVWFNTNVYGIGTELAWTVQYQAYTTNAAIVPGGQIKATNAYNIDLGQSLLVNTPQGTGTVNTGIGVPGAISVVSNVSSQLTCGISQLQPNSTTASPMCAFPLFGNMTDVIAPIEKVLIMFAAGPINNGTVIVLSSSQGVLVDLTAENDVTGIKFDINKGWDTGGQANCTLVPSNSNLIPLLVQPSGSLARQVLARSAPAIYETESIEA